MQNSKIEWTDHTLNFWWGCVKVSPGCEHCYAETLSTRYGRNIWGPAKTTERWRTKGPWNDVWRWEKKAKAEGVRRRVFCQSMSDFFEDHPQLTDWRIEACEILESLEWLDVQLLTKRPENIRRMVRPRWLKEWPAHIWVGTSVENQEYADKRIPELLKIPAAVRFLSVEPLLGPVNISEWLSCDTCLDRRVHWCGANLVDWVIVGGESGHNARPMHPDWARGIRDQCQEAGVPFFMKQWGEWLYRGRFDAEMREHNQLWIDQNTMDAWARLGKKHAGRLLDGREWNEFPE